MANEISDFDMNAIDEAITQMSKSAPASETSVEPYTFDPSAVKMPSVPEPQQDPSLLKQAANFGLVAANETALGLIRPINTAFYGTAYAAKNAVTGEGGDDFLSRLGAGFQKAYEDVDTSLKSAQEELGPWGTTAAAVAGGLNPIGLPRKIDQALEAGTETMRLVAPTVADKWMRAGRGAVAGGSTNAMQGYFEGNTSFEDMAFNGGFGAVTGGVMQRLLGETAVPYLEHISPKIRPVPRASTLFLGNKEDPAYGAVINDLTSRGMDQEGISYKTLSELADRPNAGPILTTQIGNAPIWKQWAGLNDAIAETAFAGVNPRKVNLKATQEAIRRYEDMTETIGGYQRKVNADMIDEITAAVDAPNSRYEYLVENSANLRDATAIMNRMSQTVPTPDVPNPLGAQTLKTKEFLDGIEGSIPGAYGRRSMLEAPPEARKMYGKFNDLIRGIDQESTARDFRNIPSEGKNAPRADEIFADIPIARLMDARKSFSAMLSPQMAFASGTSPAELKAGLEILKLVDKQIDEYTHGAAGMARGAFAKAKRVEEAYDMGQKFYTQRVGELADNTDFTAYYGKHLDTFLESMDAKGDNEVSAAFKAGFRKSMLDKVGNRSFMSEMKNFIGDYDPTVPEGKLGTKNDNLKMMEKILGKGEAKKILDIYFHGDALDTNTTLLVDAFREKGINPKEATALSRQARKSLGVDSYAPEFVKGNLLPLIRKLAKPSDRRKAEAAMDLVFADGESLSRMLRTGLEQGVGGFPTQLGIRSATMFAPEMGAPDTQEEAGDEIANYLKQTLGIP